MTDLFRVVGVEVAGDGRTLEGLAFKWDTPSRVQDPGAPAYKEAFTRGALKAFLGQTRKVPLGLVHPWAPGARTSPVPLGAVEFAAGDVGAQFRARVSKTVAGDEALALIADEALNSVSLGFRSINHFKRGDVLFRSEVHPFELSLVPTGMNAHDGAEILAVRSGDNVEDEAVESEAGPEVEGTPRLDDLRKRYRKVFLLG